MRPADLETRQTRSFDGSDLSYQVTRGQGPWVLLINGPVGSYHPWSYLVDYLHPNYRFITWSYRGLQVPGGAEIPRGLSLPAVHARDLATILDAENIKAAIWAAWSGGSQIALEAWRDSGPRATHLILLNPTLGCMNFGPLGPVRAHLSPRLLGLLERAHGLLAPATRRASRWPETASWLKRLGVVGPTIDEQCFAEMTASFADINIESFFRILSELETHDPSSALDAIEVPTLLVIGQRDRLAPRDKLEIAARRIAKVELFVIRGATHYAPIEYPELINLRVEKFLREHGV
jgi:pimeloyl-ACP methyl ester carboxylesterase